MSRSNAVDFSSQPFTFTDSVDSQSFQSMMSTLSQNAASGLSVSLSPEQSSVAASFSSLMASITGQSGQGTSTGVVSTTFATSTIPPNAASSQTSSLVSSSITSHVTTSGSVVAVSTGSRSGSSGASSNGSSAVSTASSAASNTNTNLQQNSTGGLSSPGLKAAVAVPVAILGILIIALIALCVRRRKKRQRNDDMMEKMPATSDGKKKWSRHLRIFSFDTELLMGGRFSSTNSIRSRQTGSVRSQTRSQHTPAPSEHSVESEVAPPYRDALAAGGGAVAGGAVAGGAVAAGRAAHTPSPLGRSVSNATAPPPYIPAGTAGSVAESTRPTTAQSNSNPFADSTSPISPVENSPFNDPMTPSISRNSSLYQNNRDETSSLGGVSDAASIREATLARNASVMSGGRIIQNVNGRSS